MFIVTRTFRDANGVFEVGSVVGPTSVKAFRSRLQQRHIVDVDETNIKEWALFFQNRHGIDLSDKLAEYLNKPEHRAPTKNTKPAAKKRTAKTTQVEKEEPKPTKEEAKLDIEEPVESAPDTSADW